MQLGNPAKEAVAQTSTETHPAATNSQAIQAPVAVPKYLEQTYWWAYLHPRGVNFFERQWLVNLILWGNYVTLRDAAFAELASSCGGRVLQVACVYGDFTVKLAQHLGQGTRLDVIDVAPVQLENLRRKIGAQSGVTLHHQDSANLAFADQSYDCVVVFFLLHEQPVHARIRTIQEALRVTRPGGKIIFVDYHRPARVNPMRYVMRPILGTLEPYALDMWSTEIASWLPADVNPACVEKNTYFGGLYQKVVVTL
jgi:ubiquinone/menaquinone biosynthesis C-methylase UbiE